MTGLCTNFSITGNTTNEKSLSEFILTIANSGEFVIRDLGYFVLDIFRNMIDKHIFFISRLNFGISLFNLKTSKQLSIPTF